MLTKLNAKSMYVHDIPLNMEPKDFKSYFWSEYNTICKKCKSSCKQSYKVKLVQCPHYKEIE